MKWLKSRSDGPVGLVLDQTAKPSDSHAHPPGGASLSKSAKKNQKRKEKKKQQVQQDARTERNDDVTAISDRLTSARLDGGGDGVDRAAVEKKLRNLLKRLKAIDDLREKIESGELKKPEAQQLEKIERRPEVVRQIEELQATLE